MKQFTDRERAEIAAEHTKTAASLREQARMMARRRPDLAEQLNARARDAEETAADARLLDAQLSNARLAERLW